MAEDNRRMYDKRFFEKLCNNIVLIYTFVVFAPPVAAITLSLRGCLYIFNKVKEISYKISDERTRPIIPGITKRGQIRFYKDKLEEIIEEEKRLERECDFNIEFIRTMMDRRQFSTYGAWLSQQKDPFKNDCSTRLKEELEIIKRRKEKVLKRLSTYSEFENE